MISKYILEKKKYNAKNLSDLTWEMCDLRKWLNDDFYLSAFTATERSRITAATYPVSKNSEYKTNSGNETTEMITIPTNLILDTYLPNREERKATCTPWINNQPHGYHKNEYWLRTPGYKPYMLMYVTDSGSPHSYGAGADEFFGRGVRPCMWVKI